MEARLLGAVSAGLALTLCACTPGTEPEAPAVQLEGTPTIRVAVYNIRELSIDKIETVDADGRGSHPPLQAAAGIIQQLRPDILVIQEIDTPDDAPGPSGPARSLASLYLAQGPDAIDYPHIYSASTNTGTLTGIDLDGDAVVATDEHRGDRIHGGDTYGFGTYQGQYGMAVLSRFPIDTAKVRTFQHFLWRDFDGHHMPPGFYSDEAEAIFRLSSKSHWDVPIQIGDQALHFLVSHPTPPSFDGDEDRNGRRNFDEIGLWAHYLDNVDWLVDDNGVAGGLDAESLFIVAGDLNASPGIDAVYENRTAISQLLDHPRIQEPSQHRERPTASFLGGRRVDYLLPARGLEILDGGVYAPDPGVDPQGAAAAETASDHRLVWLDLRL